MFYDYHGVPFYEEKDFEDQVFAERFILKGGLIDLTITLK